jgi:hypothetical protein
MKNNIIIRRTIASFFILMFLSSCDPNPKVSGKVLSEWVADLEDQDPRTVRKALKQMVMTDKDKCSRIRKPLLKLVGDESRNMGNRSDAAVLLYSKFGETDPAWVDLLLASGSPKAWDALLSMQRSSVIRRMISSEMNRLANGYNSNHKRAIIRLDGLSENMEYSDIQTLKGLLSQMDDDAKVDAKKLIAKLSKSKKNPALIRRKKAELIAGGMDPITAAMWAEKAVSDDEIMERMKEYEKNRLEFESLLIK